MRERDLLVIRDAIIFCGAITEEGKPSRGGVESGNRRLVTLLSRMGYRITELRYRQNGANSWQKLGSYSVGFSAMILKLLAIGRNHRIFHIAPLSRIFLSAECCVMLTAKLVGLKIVTQLRAGSQISEYESRTPLYRLLYRRMIALSDAVVCQGRVYEDFVSRLSPGKRCYFLPNFVFTGEIAGRAPRAMTGLRLVYVGVIGESKGCLHAIRLLQELRRTAPQAQLTLIGKQEPGFAALLAAEDNTNVVFTGPLNSREFGRILDESHYFIFLTHYKGEGHSNALTEAMARGCVPVATRRGFNENIVGDAGFLVGDRDDIGGIAKRLLDHWRNGSWKQDSLRAVQRIEENFSDAAIRPTLEQVYHSLVEKQPKIRDMASSNQCSRDHEARSEAQSPHAPAEKKPILAASFRPWLKASSIGDRLVRRTPGIYGKFRALLSDMDAASADSRRRLRQQLTARSLRQACRASYGRKRDLAGPYEAWPILEKNVLRDEGSSLQLKTWLPATRSETGGTTGIPIALRRSWTSVVFEQAALDHLVFRYGGLEWRRARVAVMRGDTIKDPSDMTPPFWRLQHGGQYLALSSNHLNAATVGAYITQLEVFGPNILWVYPSALEALCRLGVQKLASIPRLKIIVSSSEVLTPEAHAETSDAFRVPVLDYYGQAERVCLCYSVDGKDHFFVPAYGRVDLRYSRDDETHSLYEVVGTSYWNAAQPLIRYATGDLARLPKNLSAAEIDEITLGMRPFAGIEGRRTDYLVSPDGSHLIGINHIPRGITGIAQMQIRQRALDHVEIQVVPQPDYGEAVRDRILANARQKIPTSMKIDVVPVDRLQRTIRGKAPLVVRDMSSQE